MPKSDCAELELELLSQGEGQYQLHFRFVPARASAVINLGGPFPVVLNFTNLLALHGLLEEYGSRLTDMVFAAPGAASAFGRARDLAETTCAHLRIRLYFGSDPGQLHNLLWETLLDPNRRTPLAMDENVLFSRFLAGANSAATFAPPEIGRLRLLVMIASPANMDPDRYAPIDACGALEQIRQSLPEVDIISLAGGRADGVGVATRGNLLDQLHGETPGRCGCDVFYLAAHGIDSGGAPAILLERPDGGGERVPVDSLADGIAGLRHLPSLAILVSCGSAGNDAADNAMLALGPRLAGIGIPAVLAMHGNVTFSTMERFIPTFFAELQRDGEIENAVAVARRKVRDRPDWWMPVLFCSLLNHQILRPPALSRTLRRLHYEPVTIYIPPGPFHMGRDPAPGVPVWETPQHTVDLPAFRIGKYPVTNREFAEFVRQTKEPVDKMAGWHGQAPLPDRIDYPVAGVTWYQALKYCQWLSKTTGRSYQIPTEAQWERAARGRQGWLYPWGNDWQAGRCNGDPSEVTPVDRYPAQNEYGVHDMIGNVQEWTLSLWGGHPTEPDPEYCYPCEEEDCNDLRASTLVRRIYRGGAAASPAKMTCTARGGNVPDMPFSLGGKLGFRVVLLQAADYRGGWSYE